jgi:flavin reductase (DIM6/NTAB) family NADH-FMN oxidoreductase RutF
MNGMDAVSPDSMKAVMRRWASTVNIITTRTDDMIYGLTATAFSSLSVEPPLVFVCVNKKTRTHPLIEQSGIFCVNFLAADMRHISDRFAGRVPDEERFKDLAYRSEATGAPVLNDAVAFLDCAVHEVFAAGDHTIFVGLVKAAGVHKPDEAPLMYFSGKYHKLGDAL